MRAQDEQRRLVGLCLRRDERSLEHVEVVGDVAEFDDVPVVRPEPADDVVVGGQVGRPVDGDAVVVEHADQASQPEVARERCGLVADALHHAAVTGDDERVVVLCVVAEAGAQTALGDRHADRVAEALTERTGGDLDGGGVAGLGVPGRARLPLAEVAQVVEFEAGTRQEQHRVLQDRRVAVGEDEAIAVGPVRIGRVVVHHPAEQHVGEGSERHGSSLVPAVGGEGGVHGHAPGEGDELSILFGGQRHAVDST